MSKLSEKQLLLTSILVPALLIGGVGWLTWSDYQKVYAAEISDEHPEAAEIADAELWGERRKCQEITKEMDKLRGEADLIAKREQDVIVYREIVQRDSKILPDKDLVNQLTNTINDFERQSGVMVTDLQDLNAIGDPGQAIRRLPIRLALSGSFDQFLKFLNLFETMDRMVNTKGFQISQGQRLSDDPSAPAVHAIQLELETYVYNSSAGLSKPVQIANYERRKEDPVIQKLVRQQKEARVEKYQLKPRINRRDPLVDPRRSQVGPDAATFSEKEFDAMRDIVQKLKHDLELLREDLRIEQQFQQEKKYLQYVQAKNSNDKQIQTVQSAIKAADAKIVIPEVREQFVEEVLVPFTQLASERANPVGPKVEEPITRREVAEFVQQQRDAYEKQSYEKAVELMKQLDQLLAQPHRKLMEEAEPLVAEMREYARKAGVMIEFDQMRIQVSGLIRRPQGSIVIVNGKSRKEGDCIDEAGRCRLVAIKDDALVFEFDGYEIENQLKR